MKACGRAMGEAVWVKHPLPGCSSSPFLLLTCCICRQCFMLQCARWRIWCVKRGLKIFAVHYSCVMMSTFQKAVRCYLCLCRFCVLLSLIFLITDTELESLHLPATMSTLEFVFFFFLQCRNILWANIVKCEEALWCTCLGLQDCVGSVRQSVFIIRIQFTWRTSVFLLLENNSSWPWPKHVQKVAMAVPKHPGVVTQ